MDWLSNSIALGRDPGGLLVAKLGASLLSNEDKTNVEEIQSGIEKTQSCKLLEWSKLQRVVFVEAESLEAASLGARARSMILIIASVFECSPSLPSSTLRTTHHPRNITPRQFMFLLLAFRPSDLLNPGPAFSFEIASFPRPLR